jgi:hypothetical protein
MMLSYGTVGAYKISLRISFSVKSMVFIYPMCRMRRQRRQTSKLHIIHAYLYLLSAGVPP